MNRPVAPAPDNGTRGQAPSGAQSLDPHRSSPPNDVVGGGGETAAFIKTFPCVSCGARLSFAPGTTSLRCEYCAAENAIEADDARVEELDLDAWLRSLQGTAEYEQEERVRCGKCGAEEILDGVHFATKCSFCGTALVSKSYAGRHVKPRGIVPFQVDRRAAHDAFRRWLATRWLAPGDLKRYARTDESLNGVYMPYWTYDCETVSEYEGARGERHDKTTTWTSVSGSIRHFHDDVLVPASHSLPSALQRTLSGWNTAALVPYKPEYLSGFHAEAYQVDLAASYPMARRMIDERIRQLIGREIGGAAQRIDRVETQYGRFTFKHVLLPAWVSAYRYRDKVYRFVVNAQTGDIAGEAPWSWWKVAALAIVVLIILYNTR